MKYRYSYEWLFRFMEKKEITHLQPAPKGEGSRVAITNVSTAHR